MDKSSEEKQIIVQRAMLYKINSLRNRMKQIEHNYRRNSMRQHYMAYLNKLADCHKCRTDHNRSTLEQKQAVHTIVDAFNHDR